MRVLAGSLPPPGHSCIPQAASPPSPDYCAPEKLRDASDSGPFFAPSVIPRFSWSRLLTMHFGVHFFLNLGILGTRSLPPVASIGAALPFRRLRLRR